MYELITNDLMVTATILIILAGLVLLLQTKYRSVAAGMLLFLCLEAEDELGGGGTGPFKLSAVLTRIYDKLPPLAKLLISRKQMEDMIEFAVKKMKEYLLTIDTDIPDTNIKLPEDE